MPNKGNQGDKKRRVIKINLSWFYILLLVGLGWMLFHNQSPQPVKVEWAQVKQMMRDGDIKEIHFVRNDYKGSITLRPERAAKYADMFPGGQLPAKSPQFTFLVSVSFNAEQEFEALNEALPADSQVKIVMENASKDWLQWLEWLLWPVLLILMWVWMFRGMNRTMNGGPGAGGGPGGIFNVGKSTGKLANKKDVKVTFKDVAGLYGAKEEVMEIGS